MFTIPSPEKKNLVNSNVVGGVVLESVGPSDVQVVSDKQSKKRTSLLSVSFSLHAQLTPIYTIFAPFDVSGVSPLYRDSGDCTSVCMQCGALFWRAEHVKSYFMDKQLHYHRCCENGRVYLPRYEDPPAEFKRLLETPAFLNNVRPYNQMFIMTSFGARIDETINDGRSPYVFKISGQIYHSLGRLSEVVVTQLVKLLDSNYALVKLFRTARDKCAGSEVPTFKFCLYNLTGSSQHALPTSDAIGAIVFDSGPQSISDCDVIIEPRSQLPRRIHDRLNSYNLILRLGRLFQQYVVTAYCSIELDRMDYIRNKQNDIRAEYLSGMYDAIDIGDKTGSDVGSMTILPTSFTGGPRYMYSHFLDALAISRVFGNPVNEFINFLKDERPLGHVHGVLYTIEFQKRGLPHCHTLVWVHSSVSAAIRDNLDDYISAELPDLRIDFPGYAVISATMMHGPCGLANKRASCNQNFSCSKKFPKKCIDKTYFNDNGRAHYRRRNTGIYTMRAGVHLDNSYVVPYNRLLCMAFQAYINVECCGMMSLIKYLFKYISKGTDRVAVRIAKPIGSDSRQSQKQTQLVDEIKNFIDAQFICPHEACWRIFNFPIHHREPAVQILTVHLENMQLVKFPGKQPLRNIVENAEDKKTTLTEWLNYNASSVSGSHLTYLDFPTEFVWYESKKLATQGKPKET
ncbi:uncharacterized protein [Rutidosis leptorrhynchoides]|uniref:uncharacterized protein n=1 Tax=Rutidosis leptorrhynchoides TaxID=125765 RepID=UPI003A999DCF